MEAQEQERDTRNPTVRVVVECEGLDEVLHDLTMQTFSMKFSKHPTFRLSRLRLWLLFVAIEKLCHVMNWRSK